MPPAISRRLQPSRHLHPLGDPGQVAKPAWYLPGQAARAAGRRRRRRRRRAVASGWRHEKGPGLTSFAATAGSVGPSP